MREELHAEVVAPPPKRRNRRLAIAIAASSVAGTALGALAAALLIPPRLVTRTLAVEAPAQRVVEQVPVVVEAPKPEPVRDVALLLTIAGDTYMELDVTELPKHGTPRLVDDDGDVVTAIADVSMKHASGDLSHWQDRAVTVDGTCEARVTGFAVIARAVGNPRDAGEGLTDWTARSVMEHGSPRVMARLEGCTGAFARDASLPAITVLADREAPEMLDAARARFLASNRVASAQQSWREAGNEGNWYESAGQLESRVMRHPGTGVLWVIVYVARNSDCDDIGSALGLYRVEANGSLTTVSVRDAGISQVDYVIDVEGDGEPELVEASTETTSLTRAIDGGFVQSLGPAYYGCGC